MHRKRTITRPFEVHANGCRLKHPNYSWKGTTFGTSPGLKWIWVICQVVKGVLLSNWSISSAETNANPVAITSASRIIGWQKLQVERRFGWSGLVDVWVVLWCLLRDLTSAGSLKLQPKVNPRKGRYENTKTNRQSLFDSPRRAPPNRQTETFKRNQNRSVRKRNETKRLWVGWEVLFRRSQTYTRLGAVSFKALRLCQSKT